MNAIQTLLTEHLDLWTSADTGKKLGRGRSSGNAECVYGIGKLRELILELAVRGKLVPQDTNDESATELLKRVAADKALMVKEGIVRKEKDFPQIAEDEIPFNLPEGWGWGRVNDVGHDWGQKTPDATFTYIDVSAIDNSAGVISSPTLMNASDAPSRARKIVQRGTVIYSTVRPYLKNICVIEEDYEPEPIASTAFAILHPLQGMPGRFFALYFRSPEFVKYVESVQTGIAYPAINDKQFYGGLVPIPPLAEQHRIVAKVDELMALCDQLEQQQTYSIEAHQTLVASLLGTLTRVESQQEFNAAWARIASHFDTLFTTEASIDQLKQTLLQLAVMGKLVPQDPNDEPIGKTIDSIEPLPRPARYAKRSPELIKGICGLSINNPQTPHPSGWLWIPLVDIARLESGHTPSRNRPDWWGGDVPWLGLVDARIHNNGVIFETIQYTNEAGLANSAARLLPAGTVCFSRTASVGYVVVMGRPMATSQDFVNWVPSSVITSDWLKLVMVAERPAIDRFSKGAVHQTIYYPAWLSMHIALPPVAEQHRIVAKVDELMALCDALKARLADAQTTQLHLADAIVERAVC